MLNVSAFDAYYGKSGKLISLKEVDSTNTYAVKHELPPFTCVVAEKQTAGRGRSGRQWHSNTDQNLYFSIVIDGLDASMLLPLNIFAGYLLSDTLKDIVDAKVKWPNDMVVNGKKLAGILMETTFSGGTLEKVVLGIGLNVNCESFDDEIKDIATSLYIETGQKFEREKILASFVLNLENSFEEFRSKRIEVEKLWSTYSAYLDKKISIHKDGVKTIYTEKGIDTTGCLLALDESGSLQTIITGDIGYDFCR
ncbi:MAG: biotin--[acetyl-CoA-carboxylase] ligase [Denitrovibrio sp.]|nr:MAG: biotin--[acetyl-CoA-carboxylase] ligase [Denitrovibrio sp.]